MLPLKTKLNNTNIGKYVENLAINYLKSKNLFFLEKNFRSRFGEIDLIFKDVLNKQIIFAEVRYRKYIFFGTPEETVNRAKQKKIITTANYFLYKKLANQDLNCRFDIVACLGPLNNIKIDWIKDAFSCYSS